jgi:hypothetical protein
MLRLQSAEERGVAVAVLTMVVVPVLYAVLLRTPPP